MLLLRPALRACVPEAGRTVSPSPVHALSQVPKARGQVSSPSQRERRATGWPLLQHLRIRLPHVSKFMSSVTDLLSTCSRSRTTKVPEG